MLELHKVMPAVLLRYDFAAGRSGEGVDSEEFVDLYADWG
jgi:hypothetical protein